MSKVKINIVTPQFYPAVSYGGPVFSTLNTAKELAKLGNEIHVSTTNANWDTRLDVNTKQKKELSPNIFVRYYNETILNKISIPMLLGLWKDMKNNHIVMVQYIFAISTPICLLYAELLNKPVLLSPRGSLATWILENGKRKQEWLRYLIKPFSKRIYWHATAEQEKQDILKLFPGSHVFIVPNCVQLDEYTQVNTISRKQFVKQFANIESVEEPSHILVSMGRLQKKKGFDILIQSFAEVKKQFPQSVLFIAGKDEGQLKSLTALAASLGLADSVYFCGHIQGQQKIDFLSNADVFVLPSHNENFGNVYAEALACGLPIVASTTTPWQEAEINGCGRWVDNTVKATSEATIEILQKGKTSYSQNCKTFVQKFSGESIGSGFNEIIRTKILKRK